MAVSDIEELIADQTIADSQKVTDLYNRIKSILTYLTTIRTTVANENDTLNDLMDANGNNSEEHHAKTMVFYGRKLSNRDLLNGVKATDVSHTQPPMVGNFTGLDDIISQNDIGRISITWNCMTADVAGLYKSDGIPQTTDLTQPHMLGSKITMPTIQNLDSDGRGAGTNTYKLKNGYIINGWKVCTNSTYGGVDVYLYDDTGNDYLYKSGSTAKVPDTRVFAFSSTVYKIPFNTNILPGPVNDRKIVFQLDVIPIWFNIEFVVRHGTPGPAAPCRVPIKTKINNTIVLPLTTNIIMDDDWEIDTDTYVYGQWTTVDPSTKDHQIDPDGDEIPDKDFNAGESQLVGTDLDAGIRRLFLKIKSTS